MKLAGVQLLELGTTMSLILDSWQDFKLNPYFREIDDLLARVVKVT